MKNNILRPSPTSASLPWWVTTIVIFGALLMATGAVIGLVHPAMLVSPQDQITAAVRIYAGYLVSRNLAVGLLLLVALARKFRTALGTLMVLTACIQLLDAVLDFTEGRWSLIPGIVIFAIIFFIGAAKVSGHPFWTAKAWRDNGVER